MSVWGRGSALQPFVMAGFLAVLLVIGISSGWPILRRVRVELALAILAVLVVTVSAFVVDGTSRFQKPLLILLTVVTAALITTGLFRIIPGSCGDRRRSNRRLVGCHCLSTWRPQGDSRPGPRFITRDVAKDQTMKHGAVLWTLFLVFGALLWLSSVGVWSHPVYRLGLMLAFLVWCAEVVRTRKVR